MILGLATVSPLCIAESEKSLVVALKPDKNPDLMLEERKQLESFLKQELKLDVKVVVPTSGAVILEGLSNGTIDLAYLSSLDLVRSLPQKSASALLVGEIDGKKFYSSMWLVRKDNKETAIDAFKGKRIAFSSRTSTSGFLIPHSDLIDRKLLKPKEDPEAFFGKRNVFYGSGYVSAVERVLNGDAEAAAVSDYVFLKDKHLSPEQRAQLRVLQTQGPVPTHIIAVSTRYKHPEKLKKALLKLNNPEFHSLRDRVFTSKLVEGNQVEHIAPIEKALNQTGASL